MEAEVARLRAVLAERSQAALDRDREAEVARLRKAVDIYEKSLKWIASFDRRDILDNARTLHYDVCGRATAVLNEVAILGHGATATEGATQGRDEI
jgi:hypothetical protein